MAKDALPLGFEYQTGKANLEGSIQLSQLRVNGGSVQFNTIPPQSFIVTRNRQAELSENHTHWMWEASVKSSRRHPKTRSDRDIPG